ncbi:MAG: class A beta-lactamase-related serine hydrolase [Actinomycetota bacterium]|nr:class A beta-lactamase-related serine hydrolase [Actinomycetota bacterium]
MASTPGFDAGICARGLEGPLVGESAGVGEDQVLPSASLIKVLVLAELLRQADRGTLYLEEELEVWSEDLVDDSEMLAREQMPTRMPVRRLAEGMITLSDNAATNLLIRRLGIERVNDLARDLGLRNTSLRREMMDVAARARGEENLTTASEMVVLLGEIWHGPSLSQASRAFALELLLGQRIESKISLTLPAGAGYAHKTGELQGVENDAGLVLVPGRTFALAVLVRGDVERALPLVGRAVSAVCETFAGSW